MSSLPPLIERRNPRPLTRRWFVPPLVVVLAWGAMFMAGRHAGGAIRVVNNITAGKIRALIAGRPEAPKLPKLDDDPDYGMPDKEKQRLDVLILGIRGQGDAVNGGLLTDTMLLVSLNKETGNASLVSIPRDLYVRLSDKSAGRINTAYAYLGLNGVRKLVSRVTGVYVDHAVLMDFEAFRTIVDQLGGITITLDEPFEESQQWTGDGEYSFSLPAGENTLNGEQALYFVRSRYSTSDFDRSRRQMQVILAIKDKVAGLGLMSDPVAAIGLLNSVRKHVETDLDIFDAGTLRDLAGLAGDAGRIRRYVLDSGNLLYDAVQDGAYHLLPRGGTLAYVKSFLTGLPDTAVMPEVSPPPSPSGTP